MTDAGVQEAIVAHLVKEHRPKMEFTQTGPSGWISYDEYRGGPVADPSTIEFRKSKSFPSCQLHLVIFRTHDRTSMCELIKTWQEVDGSWLVHSCGGGGAGHPLRSALRVGLIAEFGKKDFSGFGGVLYPPHFSHGSQDARSVRLTFANDIMIEDTIDDGVVLFFEPHRVVAPAEVAVNDANGDALVTYMEFVDFAEDSPA